MDRRAAKRDKKRLQIIDKATEILRKEGIGAVTIRRIGDEMDLTAPSIYTYFPDKSDIIYAVYEKSCDDMLAHIVSLPNQGTLDSFLAFVRAIFLFRLDNWYRLRDTLHPYLPKERYPDSFLKSRQVLTDHLKSLHLMSLSSDDEVFEAMRVILALIDGSIQFVYGDVSGHDRNFSMSIVLKGVSTLYHAWQKGL